MTNALPRRRAGFTLAEIMIVVVMIGLVSAFAVPRLDVARYRSDAAAKLVLGIFQRAARISVQRQHDVVVSLAVARGRLRILEDRNNDRVADEGEPVSWRSLEESYRFATPPGGVAGSADAAVVGATLREVDGMPSITFHRNGSTSTAAEVYLTSPRAAGTDFRAVTVAQATGQLKWFRYSGSAWKEIGK